MTEVVLPSGEPPRSALRLVVDPVFGALFWGKVSASAGLWILTVVSAMYVFEATGSALAVGVVSAAQFAPALILTPIAGAWADHGFARRQMLIGRIFSVTGTAMCSVWCFVVDSAAGWQAVWPLAAGALLVGIGFTVASPVQNSIIPAIVRPEELSTAMALNTAPMSLTRVFAPVLAAVVVTQLGPAEGFLLATAAQLVYAVLVALTALPRRPPRQPDTDLSVRAGIAFVRSDRSLVLVLVAITTVGFGSEPSITLAPALAADFGGPSLVGVLTAAFGAGAIVGLLVVAVGGRTWSQMSLATQGLAIMAVGALTMALTGGLVACVGGFVLMGAGFATATAALGTLAQVGVPRVLRGRIQALWLFGFMAPRPFATSGLGALSDATSPRIALAVIGITVAIVTMLCRPSRLAR